jgi:hypothetical protein
MTVIVAERYCGPPDSANGGYAAGMLARHLGGTVEVTLRRPPPLGRALSVERPGARAVLMDGAVVIAEAAPATVEIEAPAPVGWDRAVAAAASSRFLDPASHPFPTCYVCGPSRAEGDGLRIFAGRVPGTELFAAPWIPADVSEENVWAALDCPSSAPPFADETLDGPFVLGRIAARIDRVPAPGHRHVIMSWGIGRDGRKVFTASAIYGRETRPCAVARATWIQIPSAQAPAGPVPTSP